MMELTSEGHFKRARAQFRAVFIPRSIHPAQYQSHVFAALPARALVERPAVAFPVFAEVDTAVEAAFVSTTRLNFFVPDFAVFAVFADFEGLPFA
jgi:hypothetical protein